MKEKYHILVVLRWLGGIRTFCRYVYNQLDNSKFRYTLLAPQSPETDHLLDDLRGLELTYIPVPCDPAFATLDMKLLCRTILTKDFDMIHSHGFTAGLYCAVPARIRGIPHVMTCHDTFQSNQFLGMKGKLLRHAIRHVTPKIDIVHSVSQAAQENFFEYFPGFKSKYRKHFVVIRNGIEVSRFLNPTVRNLREELNLDDDTFVIGFIGRFMSPKGFKYLIDALKYLYEDNDLPRKPIVIAVNDGGFIRQEMERIRKMGLEKCVYFLPFVSNIASTIKGMDVIVMPSLWESCGLVAMESMVSGVPFIGTSIPALKEIALNSPSRLIPPSDAKALADALQNEMESPTLEKARKFCEEASTRYDVKVQAKELQELFLSMMK